MEGLTRNSLAWWLVLRWRGSGVGLVDGLTGFLSAWWRRRRSGEVQALLPVQGDGEEAGEGAGVAGRAATRWIDAGGGGRARSRVWGMLASLQAWGRKEGGRGGPGRLPDGIWVGVSWGGWGAKGERREAHGGVVHFAKGEGR